MIDKLTSATDVHGVFSNGNSMIVIAENFTGQGAYFNGSFTAVAQGKTIKYIYIQCFSIFFRIFSCSYFIPTMTILIQ